MKSVTVAETRHHRDRPWAAPADGRHEREHRNEQISDAAGPATRQRTPSRGRSPGRRVRPFEHGDREETPMPLAAHSVCGAAPRWPPAPAPGRAAVTRQPRAGLLNTRDVGPESPRDGGQPARQSARAWPTARRSRSWALRLSMPATADFWPGRSARASRRSGKARRPGCLQPQDRILLRFKLCLRRLDGTSVDSTCCTMARGPARPGPPRGLRPDSAVRISGRSRSQFKAHWSGS